MRYEHDTCTWDDMKDHFSIERHALQINTPQDSNGDIACINKDGQRKYPRMDYSHDTATWWYLQRTDITVPSQHTQDGKQYAAEVTLSHFYSIDDKNKVRYQLSITCLFSVR